VREGGGSLCQKTENRAAVLNFGYQITRRFCICIGGHIWDGVRWSCSPGEPQLNATQGGGVGGQNLKTELQGLCLG
jgi:hypothetical protein